MRVHVCLLLIGSLLAAPAAAKCRNDMDCKGERVCEKGQCVNLPSSKRRKVAQRPKAKRAANQKKTKWWLASLQLAHRPGASADMHSWCSSPGSDSFCGNGLSVDFVETPVNVSEQLLIEGSFAAAIKPWLLVGVLGSYSPSISARGLSSLSSNIDLGAYASYGGFLALRADVGGRFKIEPSVRIGTYEVWGGRAIEQFHESEIALCQELHAQNISCFHTQGTSSSFGGFGLALIFHRLAVPLRVGLTTLSHSRITMGETHFPDVGWETEEHILGRWETIQLFAGVEF